MSVLLLVLQLLIAYQFYQRISFDLVGGVVVFVLVLNVGRSSVRATGGSKFIFTVSLLSLKVRAKTGWVGIGIIFPSGATCLLTDCCFSELGL